MIHPAPVLGTALSLRRRLFGLGRRCEELKKSSRAIPADLTGDPGEETVESPTRVEMGSIEVHEDVVLDAFSRALALGVAER